MKLDEQKLKKVEMLDVKLSWHGDKYGQRDQGTASDLGRGLEDSHARLLSQLRLIGKGLDIGCGITSF